MLIRTMNGTLTHNVEALLSGFEFEKQKYMTKEQLSDMAAEAYNRLGKNPPPYQWMDGYVAGYVACQQNLQQCNVIRSQQCSEHKPNKLSYLQWHDDAEKRTKAGQKQKQCPKCSLWLWEDEY